MSTSARFIQKLAVLTISAAIAATAAACGTSDKTEPAPTPGSSAPVSSPSEPTQKNLSPTGGNSFTPGEKAQPAPTAAPGRHKY